MITLIVARARNGAIGRDGTMPWHLPEDLAFFKTATKGGALIMGSRTWKSLPVRPLPGRLNLVVSSDPTLSEHVVPGIDAALARAEAEGYEHVFGMGGARIYSEMLPRADRLLITEVDLSVPDADTFFPEIDENEWRLEDETVLRDRNPVCTLRELRRA
ncbi:dihydrofolate reductase [Roseivivax sediminis]|uniref:Dihydrofolate reductase n=1 Tax=Roseivivax sediminis TaxID=936889 RepID=A0A1I2AHM4_9RHOB|nr:dihydrofolate reductase [Roseivivax sediminis]SFE42340.1 dihydrofolate reductase [Roseivivax sediminis]